SPPRRWRHSRRSPPATEDLSIQVDTIVSTMTMPAKREATPLGENEMRKDAAMEWVDETPALPRRRRHNVGDAMFHGITAGAACTLVAVIVAILGVLVWESATAIRTFGW